jgi:hypothetical protein
MSNLLSKIFQNSALEFYVVLSNSQTISEQSTYLPAALFGAGIIRERLSRNLPASVLNIPEVYFGESYHEYQKGTSRIGYRPISEEDFFAALAETITTGLHVGPDYECTVGMALIEKNFPAKPNWAANSKFSHLIYLDQLASSKGERSESESVATDNDLKVQLAQTVNPAEVLDIVRGNINVQSYEGVEANEIIFCRCIYCQTASNTAYKIKR